MLIERPLSKKSKWRYRPVAACGAPGKLTFSDFAERARSGHTRPAHRTVTHRMPQLETCHIGFHLTFVPLYADAGYVWDVKATILDIVRPLQYGVGPILPFESMCSLRDPHYMG